MRKKKIVKKNNTEIVEVQNVETNSAKYDVVELNGTVADILNNEDFYFKKDFETKDDFYKRITIKEPKRKILVKKLQENAVLPQYAKDGDIGMDLTSVSVKYDSENDLYIYSTGLAFESNFNDGALLFPRSSNSKKECYLTNHIGLADTAIYRGDIQLRYKNRTSIWTVASLNGQKAYNETFKKKISSFLGFLKLKNAVKEAELAYNKAYEQTLEDAKNLKYAPYEVGDKIGQVVFASFPTVQYIETDTLSNTKRGDKGFGSTGK